MQHPRPTVLMSDFTPEIINFVLRPDVTEVTIRLYTVRSRVPGKDLEVPSLSFAMSSRTPFGFLSGTVCLFYPKDSLPSSLSPSTYLSPDLSPSPIKFPETAGYIIMNSDQIQMYLASPDLFSHDGQRVATNSAKIISEC